MTQVIKSTSLPKQNQGNVKQGPAVIGIERMAANLTAPADDDLEAMLYPNSNLNEAIERNKVINGL